MGHEGTASPFKLYKLRRNWTIILKNARTRNEITKIWRDPSRLSCQRARYRREAVSLSCKFTSPRPSVGYSMSDNLFTARQQASRSKKKERGKEKEKEKEKIKKSVDPVFRLRTRGPRSVKRVSPFADTRSSPVGFFKGPHWLFTRTASPSLHHKERSFMRGLAFREKSSNKGNVREELESVSKNETRDPHRLPFA